ncbi:hypothetical protein ACSS6W_001814 [Trichoderma asperelloides]
MPQTLACTNSAAKTDGHGLAAPKTSLRAVANCEVGRLLQQQLGRLRAIPISNRDFDPGSRQKFGRRLIWLSSRGTFVYNLPLMMEWKMLPSPYRASRDQAPRAPGHQNLRLDCRSAGHYSVNERAP